MKHELLSDFAVKHGKRTPYFLEPTTAVKLGSNTQVFVPVHVLEHPETPSDPSRRSQRPNNHNITTGTCQTKGGGQ